MAAEKETYDKLGLFWPSDQRLWAGSRRTGWGWAQSRRMRVNSDFTLKTCLLAVHARVSPILMVNTLHHREGPSWGTRHASPAGCTRAPSGARWGSVSLGLCPLAWKLLPLASCGAFPGCDDQGDGPVVPVAASVLVARHATVVAVDALPAVAGYAHGAGLELHHGSPAARPAPGRARAIGGQCNTLLLLSVKHPR
jgi:hypothetical protein